MSVILSQYINFSFKASLWLLQQNLSISTAYHNLYAWYSYCYAANKYFNMYFIIKQK